MSVDQAIPIKRCAIYTRKSTNKRLDHDVNSLVTQREICSAYIKSQQYKAWVELPDRYDDGGHSGSGMDRPALAILMQDIEAARYEFEVSVRAITAERWPSLHIQPRSTSQIAKPDEKLVDLVQRARKAQRLVDEHRDWSIEDLAHKENCRPTFFARLIRLNYLAPDIVTAILDGTQPANLTRDIMLMSNIPTDWAIQRQLFGFPAPEREIAPRLLFGRGMWPTGAE